MIAIGYSAAVRGIDAFVVRVEVVGVATADPTIHIVGLADRSIQESKERVNAAVRSCGFLFPTYKVVVNLAPADVRKEGAAFDLALALSILAMDQQLSAPRVSEFICIGELALDGAVKAVGGVLPIAIGMKQGGFTKLILPADNLREADLVQGLTLFPVRTLHDAVRVILGFDDFRVRSTGLIHPDDGDDVTPADDLRDVRGQHAARRALEVAAAGGHNVLMVGPPGSGKTMLARRLGTILPRMTAPEALEVTKLYSVSGLLRKRSRLITSRPFRSPHHTVSMPAFAGGGHRPQPGEISLAHRGILFLDELAEFPRHILEVLRQPLEDRLITLRRASGGITYPADFMLVASFNPCPCGYSGDRVRGCGCSPYMIRRYLARLSGPLLDRIDMHIQVARLPFEDLSDDADVESSATVRRRVERARQRQRLRLGDAGCNASMPVTALRRSCELEQPAVRLLHGAVEKLRLSARAHDRILRVARTIADMAAAERIALEHLAEAISYRSQDRFLCNDER